MHLFRAYVCDKSNTDVTMHTCIINRDFSLYQQPFKWCQTLQEPERWCMRATYIFWCHQTDKLTLQHDIMCWQSEYSCNNIVKAADSRLVTTVNHSSSYISVYYIVIFDGSTFKRDINVPITLTTPEVLPFNGWFKCIEGYFGFSCGWQIFCWKMVQRHTLVASCFGFCWDGI